MKKICFLVALLSIPFLWANFSLYPNLEENITNQLNHDLDNNALKSKYDLQNFLTQKGILSFDGVIFRSPNNGLLEKALGIRNDSIVKTFYLELTKEGDVAQNQFFLDNSLVGFDYFCGKNSQITISKVTENKSYYILPMNCKMVKSAVID